MKLRLLFLTGTIIAALIGFYEYDLHVSFSYSTRTKLQVDLKAIGSPEKVWYTTSDSVISMCLQHDTWYLVNFAKMQYAPTGYLANVGASQAKSVLLQRNRGKILWRGKMLIIVEQDDELCDVFLVDSMEQADSLAITPEQRIRQGMPRSKLLHEEK